MTILPWSSFDPGGTTPAEMQTARLHHVIHNPQGAHEAQMRLILRLNFILCFCVGLSSVALEERVFENKIPLAQRSEEVGQNVST